VLGAAYIFGKALLAITLWGAATIGFLKRDMAVWERALAALAAASLVLALPITDEIGFGLAALLIGLHLWRARAAERAAA
jgi:TRAP-type uncharacterized transport system fused permease subunit